MLYLGVDGGGTKTAFILIDDKGEILSHNVKSTCHYKQTSFENFKDVINEGIVDICKDMSILKDEISYAFLGIPGFGEIQEDTPKIINIVKEVLGSVQFRCDNDSVAAWAGSLGCKPGVNMVAGTGTIAFGMNSDGLTARAGGWGHDCGDEGSAYWLGKKTIEIFSKESDRRIEKTPLYNILKNELSIGIDSDFDLIDIVTTQLSLKRDEIAKLAGILYKAAIEGDIEAIKAYKEAAFEHYLAIRSVIKQLQLDNDNEVLVSYSGGVFNAGDYVLQPLKAYLDGNKGKINLMKPILSPVAGAALYASIIHSNDYSELVLKTLKNAELNWEI